MFFSIHVYTFTRLRVRPAMTGVLAIGGTKSIPPFQNLFSKIAVT